MVAIRADWLMENRSVEAGVTKKWENIDGTDKTSFDSVKNMPEPSGVTLSSAALRLSEAIGNKHDDTVQPGDFDGFFSRLHQQLVEQGGGASFLRERPPLTAPPRVLLSLQAANYLSESLYGSDKVFTGVSALNPYAATDRRTLSTIAFDETGKFTSPERQVAFLELTERDIAYRNKTFEVKQTNGGEGGGIWNLLVSYLRDAELSSAMSDAERSWRGWQSGEDLRAEVTRRLQWLDMDRPTLPLYENKGGSRAQVLAIAGNTERAMQWQTIDLSDADSTDLILVQAVTAASNEQEELRVTGPLMAYLSISRLT